MKLITRDTDYALRAVCFIAKAKNRKVSVSELVKELKMPQPFLRKILQVLSNKDILCSCKGAGGGFILARSAKDIFLTELLEIFQGPLKLNECFFKKMKCPNEKTCLLRKKINNIEKYVVNELKAISIISLLK